MMFFGRLLMQVLDATEQLTDLEERTDDGHSYYYTPTGDRYFIPKKTMDALAAAKPGSLESVMMRRLVSLNEWEDQHPSDWFVGKCPTNGMPLHEVRYPLVSNLVITRNDGSGFWITGKMLERIYLHDPGMEGAVAKADPNAKTEEADEASEDAVFDEEGNEVESGLGGMPAEKGAEGDVAKVWIIPGCIVCDACEEASPDVFKVTETTSTVQMGSQENWTALSTSIVEAAVACPVDVIKYELKAS